MNGVSATMRCMVDPNQQRFVYSKSGNTSHGFIRPRAPEPNGQGTGVSIDVLPLGSLLDRRLADMCPG